ncbi:MAG: DinB family protein [Gemmatimonadetes bacterium]|nr:MAG: DinB family protein [Gemmatimonadota bacterium]
MMKDHILAAIEHEIRVCKHLYTKFSAEHWDYRPMEGMRSTLELLRYLAGCSISMVHALTQGYKDETGEYVFRHYTYLEEMPADQFIAEMDKQWAGIQQFFATLTDSDLTTKQVKIPWEKEPVPLGQGLIDCGVKFLTAYRMQLFLYAKLAVDPELNTANCWAGIDWKRDAEKTETS